MVRLQGALSRASPGARARSFLRQRQPAARLPLPILIEGYQYPGINHNLDQASRCAQYPWKELAWDQAHCRYLMGLYYGTWPWMREFVNVSRLELPSIKLWAYNHLCLYGWPIPLPTSDDRSFIY